MVGFWPTGRSETGHLIRRRQGKTVREIFGNIIGTLGVYTPKIYIVTRTFLGFSDMRHGTFLNLTGRHDVFLNSTGRHDVFLNLTGRHYHFL